jgi:hypothetical protein
VKSKFLTILIAVIGIFCTFFLVSCNNQQDGAIDAIKSYIQALSDKDQVQISNISCVDWEPNALIELDSLTAVGSEVQNLVCSQAGQDGEDVYISCTGILALDYDGEAQQIDLSNRVYIARQEDGEWRMCGYR